jgi:hypothetical protein
MSRVPVSLTRAPIAASIAFLLSGFGLAASRDAHGVWADVEKVVAVGDLHGDFDQFVAVLKSASLVDDQNNWTGGKTHLVQTGDSLDRGPTSRKIMDLLMVLEQQAANSGGYVHALLGNHESMNMIGDFRYTSPGEYASFRDQNSEKIRDEAYRREGQGQDRAQWNTTHPLGYFEHRAALAPNGRYGKWLLGHDCVIKINSTLFLHGGISPKYVSQKIRQINDEVRSELKQGDKLEAGIVRDLDGPLWYRGLAQANEKELEPHVNKVLKNFGVEQIVVSHTFAATVITSRFDRRVILIDIGISRVYDHVGRVGCLVIEQGQKPYVLHRGTRLELPVDSGNDLLLYLRKAAALDPPPSPLLKSIAELEARLGARAP